jgi:hypothetical protein
VDDGDAGTSYLDFPDWDKDASAEYKADIERRLNPDPDTISLSALYPCPECERWTPHFITIVRPEDGWTIQLDASWKKQQPPIGRTVQCVLCDQDWAHHVPFKGMPRNSREMSALYRRPPAAALSAPPDTCKN